MLLCDPSGCVPFPFDGAQQPTAEPSPFAVGWYLMVPPLTTPKAGNALVDSEAPLSKWTTIAWYDTAGECNQVWMNTESTQTAILTALYAKLGAEKYDAFVKGGAVGSARCIATDDPRLKGQ